MMYRRNVDETGEFVSIIIVLVIVGTVIAVTVLSCIAMMMVVYRTSLHSSQFSLIEL